MQVEATSHPEVLLVYPDVFEDPRGFFMETYHARKYAEQGLPGRFVQDNHSRSTRGVLRGLHYQLDHPQGKLVRVVAGEVFDVAVDIRRGSPYFGQWVGVTLSAENRLQMYIPPGFAHGFCTLSERADFLYKCTDFYAPGDEYGIAWDDPEIGIDWPAIDYLLSDKDRDNPRLADSSSLPVYHAD
jgi:dTDP-4-dehydrorhamnose 3,5-epimerase